MTELVIQILAGLVVAILSGSTGFLIRRNFFKDVELLPASHNYIEPRSYGHLNGNWHIYWVSYNPIDVSQPVWMHGVQELQVNKQRVEGTTEHINHPVVSSFHYVIKGEIRAGRMILTEAAIEDPTEYTSVFYPNLLSAKLLVGSWSGQDNLLRPITAPVILSRDELTYNELNKSFKSSNLTIVPFGEYKFDSGPPKTEK